MSRPLFACAASRPAVALRPAVECVVPWTEEARFSADRWDLAVEMLAESASGASTQLGWVTHSDRRSRSDSAASSNECIDEGAAPAFERTRCNSRFRLWLVAMTPAERPYSSFESACETMRRWPQVAIWKERGQRGLDRLNAALDIDNPLAVRLVADFSRAFKVSDLAEALVAGKRRPAAFGMGAAAAEIRIVAAREFERAGTVRIDSPQKALFGSRTPASESESNDRRLRPMGKVRKIRTTGANA